jgi:adenylate cyclase
MDLVGFTALTAEHGDDSAADVALRLYASVRRLLPGHAGEEIKTIGDAMMIRCEDPQRAIDLGLRIAEHLGEEPGFPPVRVGVHTGSAVYREGDWYGSGVNVAARLCSAAGPSRSTRDRRRAGRRQRHGARGAGARPLPPFRDRYASVPAGYRCAIGRSRVDEKTDA